VDYKKLRFVVGHLVCWRTFPHIVRVVYEIIKFPIDGLIQARRRYNPLYKTMSEK